LDLAGTGLSVLPASHVHTGPKISASGPIKTAELNRQTRVFRNAVTRRKQRTATCSNRQNIRFWKTDNLRATSLSVSARSDDFLAFPTGLPTVFLEGLPIAVFAKGSVCINTFLPGLPRAISAKGSVCLNTFLPGLPRAISAKGSVCANTFLPGSAQYVEIAVTRSKQTTATFLPGSRFASWAHTNSSNIDSKLSEGCAWLRL
jgi:hypothetical protein